MEQVDGVNTQVYSEVYLDLAPCPSGRFDNYTEFTETMNITNNYICLKNSTIMLQGSNSAKVSSLVYLNVA